MKQLKFMLAAATAIGLATAAQADVNTYLVGTGADAKENFDAATLGAAATSLTGYSYAGATAADNESVVVEDGYNGTQSLQVNTGTDPIVRDLNFAKGADIDMAEEGFKSLTIDTMVQFTVTPDGDTVTAGEDDKLMIYLKEVPAVTAEDGTVTTPASTKLMVKAARYTAGDPLMGTTDTFEPEDVEVTAENLTVVAGTWYNLKVLAAAENGVPVFTISIDGKTLAASSSLIGSDDTKFPSLKGTDSSSLRYVGFAGEGLVDDLLVFRTDEGETSVDFTLALADGVSAVTWTIDGVAQTDTLTGKVTAGQTIAITDVTYADWYCADGDYVKGWSGVWGTDVTANITVGAKEVTSTDLDVTVPEGTAAATVDAALAWAKAAGKSTTAVEGAANLIANYLLDVTDLAVEPQIKITGIDLSGDVPAVTAKVTAADGTTTIKTLTAENINSAASIKYKAAATLEALKSATSKAAIEAGDQFIQVVVE